ncbi:MAG: hypothetical protein KDD62_10675, partial [Bdellovibrionales bacterium]|nr:hypothetical protein [Bdellovibrionales bacterium]
GGVIWQINQTGCGKNNPHFSWGATSPDGQSVIEILPEETWAGNNLGTGQQGACPNVWAENSQDYLTTWIKHFRPGANIRSYRPRPDIAQQYQQFNRVDPYPGGEVRQWVDAGEVLLDYDINGRPYEEVLAKCIVFSLSSMQGVMPGEIRRFLTMSTMPGLSMRAPKGNLDLRIAEVVRRSGQPNPQWQALMTQHNAKMAAINRKGAIDRHKIAMDTNREIMKMNQESFEYRQKITDEGHQKFTQAIRGVENYVDPNTNEKIELPNTYNQAWRLPDDTYILTDDQNFEPFRDLGVNANKLEKME